MLNSIDWGLGSRRPGLFPMIGEGIFTQDGHPVRTASSLSPITDFILFAPYLTLFISEISKPSTETEQLPRLPHCQPDYPHNKKSLTH